MIGSLLDASNSLWLLGVALLVFGLMPGFVLALILRLFDRDDPRRRELQAELYVVPRWERPFWVLEQLEVATREGVFPRIGWWFGRLIWHRSKLESGLERHRKYPDSFWVPEGDVKALLRPGDHVKLMWSVKRFPGERMWVTVTHRDGDQLIGELDNWAVFVYLRPGETVKFHIDDIIDYLLEEDDAEDAAAA